MSWFTCPTKEQWEERQIWFENELERHLVGGYTIGEQAHALLAEVQHCYCSGSWIAVIIIAVSAIDAQLREDADIDIPSNTQKLFKIHNLSKRIDDFRKIRNRLVHVHKDEPIVTFDDYEPQEYEMLASEIASLMIETFFLYPWV